MNDRFTESELLAFVEDELDAATRTTLDARLAGDPGLRARLTAMQEDRTVLRGVPEPALPVDFIAALEPQLARPMLMQAPPGSYRRRHHRAARRSRQLRLAVAAGLLVAFGAGLWGSVSLVTGWTSGGTGDGIVRGPGRIAADPAVAAGVDTAGAEVASSDTQGHVDPGGPPPGLIVHHHAPLPGVARDTTVAAVSADRGVGANATPIVTFAIVLSDDHASAEDRLVAALDGMDVGDGGGVGSAALVRNFNMADLKDVIASFAHHTTEAAFLEYAGDYVYNYWKWGDAWSEEMFREACECSFRKVTRLGPTVKKLNRSLFLCEV